MAATALAALGLHVPAPEVVAAEFDVYAPGETRFLNTITATAVSPDGRHLVFSAGSVGTGPSLWLRPVASRSARRLGGTGRANYPFLSPDSQWVAFYQDGKLKRTRIAGGTPQVLSDAEVAPGAGGTWNRDDTVLFASAAALVVT